MQRKRSAPPHAQEPGQGAQESERIAWTVRETSLCLGLPQPTVYAYIKNGILPSIRLGGRLLVPRAAVLALLDEAMDNWDGRVSAAPRARDEVCYRNGSALQL